MRKAALLYSITLGMALAMPGMTFAQQPQNDLAVCEHPALSRSDQANCKVKMETAQTNAERAEVRAEYEEKIQGK